MDLVGLGLVHFKPDIGQLVSHDIGQVMISITFILTEIVFLPSTPGQFACDVLFILVFEFLTCHE